MTKQEKLKKIIEIAIEGGWELLDIFYYPVTSVKKVKVKDVGRTFGAEATFTLYEDIGKRKHEEQRLGAFNLSDVIFRHDFLKSYFGEEIKCIDLDDARNNLQSWEYHAERLVLSKDRIEYLWDNRPKEVNND